MEYGPQTAEIKTLIEKLGSLTPEQAESLSAAWDAAEDSAWHAAGDAIRGAAWRAGRGAAGDAVWDADWDAVRGAAWYAVWDAVRALLVKDLISEEHFDTLYGPWDSVMG